MFIRSSECQCKPDMQNCLPTVDWPWMVDMSLENLSKGNPSQEVGLWAVSAYFYWNKRPELWIFIHS